MERCWVLPDKLGAPREQPALPATLAEAVSPASTSNPNVHFADFNMRAGEDNVKAPRSLPRPQVSIVGDGNRPTGPISPWRSTISRLRSSTSRCRSVA